MRTEESLGIYWTEGGATGEVDGFEVGGLWTIDYPPPGSPIADLDRWPNGTEVALWRMHGPGWIVALWRFRMRTWPTAEAWSVAIEETLNQMIGNGASLAWAAAEGNFADPPALFDPGVMGDRVFAAATRSMAPISTASIGQPIAWLPTEVQRQLRAEALRLVDMSRPDPDL